MEGAILTLPTSRSDSVFLVHGGHGATRVATYFGVRVHRKPAQARSPAPTERADADHFVACLRSRHSATGASHARPLSPTLQATPCPTRHQELAT